LLPYHEWVNIPRHPSERTFEIADIFLPIVLRMCAFTNLHPAMMRSPADGAD
jgi:hypothetical protein